MNVQPSSKAFAGRAMPVMLAKAGSGTPVQLGMARLEKLMGRIGPAEDAPVIRLLFQISGTSRLSSGTAHEQLSAGKWTADTANAVSIEPGGGGEAILLSFPGDHLSRLLAGRVQMRGISPVPIRGAAHMCRELAQSCLANPEQLSWNVASSLGESLVELAKLAVIEQLCTRRVETVRETVRTRIQAFVQRNLDDPGLSIERIAERMDCTKRYLHKVFSDDGQTLNQYIWSQRLERCRADLAREELADKSITEIAFNCGFSNAAHFSRSFRARFGETPRSYRRAMLASAASAADRSAGILRAV